MSKPEILKLIIDPNTSDALLDYLKKSIDRDPIDVLNELEYASNLFHQQLRGLLKSSEQKYQLIRLIQLS